jgi:hypothetical protein
MECIVKSALTGPAKYRGYGPGVKDTCRLFLLSPVLQKSLRA